MPYRDPHTAAPTLWAIRQEHGPDLEVSWTAPPAADAKQHRKAIEAALIALHRRDVGASPVANFGRMIPSYEQSSYSDDERRGGPLADGETESNTAPGTEPLPWTNHDNPLAADWMGLDWTEPLALDAVHGEVPESAGVYRIWDGDTPLEYIGQSANLKSRLYRHRRTRDGSLRVAFTPVARADARHRREEIETELIGAHWLACSAAPIDQF
ncbi:GIY-YIG nuclease family protein [Halorarius halobius]|uniref:GIY-YIG nuclease family protein n=1 Tax=Halorarius halobius TaxID=2962671 RepID=UPI0020CF23C0|nr:GIY-YIG nuclease family protein [Halorarius halobius]